MYIGIQNTSYFRAVWYILTLAIYYHEGGWRDTLIYSIFENVTHDAICKPTLIFAPVVTTQAYDVMKMLKENMIRQNSHSRGQFDESIKHRAGTSLRSASHKGHSLSWYRSTQKLQNTEERSEHLLFPGFFSFLDIDFSRHLIHTASIILRYTLHFSGLLTMAIRAFLSLFDTKRLAIKKSSVTIISLKRYAVPHSLRFD